MLRDAAAGFLLTDATDNGATPLCHSVTRLLGIGAGDRDARVATLLLFKVTPSQFGLIHWVLLLRLIGATPLILMCRVS